MELIQWYNLYDNDSIETKLFGNWLSEMENEVIDDIDEYNVLNYYVIRRGSGWDNYDFKIKISRNYFVYFWKVGIYMLLLSISSICVFCMNTDSINNDNNNNISSADQLSLLFTLLLTGIALQFVVGSWLPNTSYLTLLDKYILLSFIVMFIIIIMVFIFDIFDIDLNSNLKRILSLIIIVLFVLSQIICVIIFKQKRNEELTKVIETAKAKAKKKKDNRNGNNSPDYSINLAKPIERLDR